MKRHLMITAVATVLSVAAVAQAQDDATSSAFKMLDTDQSGAISTEEAKLSTIVAQGFAKADANGDGNLTREEFGSSFTAAQPSSQTSPSAPVQPPPSTPPEPQS